MMTLSLSPLSCALPRSAAVVLAVSLSTLVGCGAQLDESDDSEPFAEVSCDLDAGTAPAKADASTGTPPDASDGSIAMPPAPGTVAIKRVAAKGRCEVDLAGSSGVAISLAEFAVAVGEDESLDSAACALSIEVDAPEGQSYALTGLRTQGVAKLGEGVSASVRSSFHFLGGPDLGAKVDVLRGPIDQALSIEATYPTDSESFLPCGSSRELRLDLSLNMRSETAAPGQISLSQLSPLRFEVRPCTPAQEAER